MIVPPSLVHPVSALKDLMDHGTSWLEQVALADFIKLGHYERHVRRVKTAYRGKCELLANALGHLVSDSIIMGGDGGMHLTWVLPERLPIARELQRELEVLGVGVYTLEEGPALCIGPSDLMEYVLLFGYPCLSEHQIATAIDIVRDVVQSMQARADR
jgi:GntR family transcriptional regulator/MocR family aminotransferase